MLGWEFFITRKENKQYIARWLAGVGGIQWVDDLVSKGMAQKFNGFGYPDIYEINVESLLNVITNNLYLPSSKGPIVIGDDYVQKPVYSRNGRIDMELLKSLPLDEILLVEVWDQS